MKVSSYRRTNFWGKVIEKKKPWLSQLCIQQLVWQVWHPTRKVNSDGECVIKGGVDYA